MKRLKNYVEVDFEKKNFGNLKNFESLKNLKI